MYRLPRDNIKMVDSALFENYMSPYDGDPRVTAASSRRETRNSFIKEIISKHEGKGIIHSHDWMAGGIIAGLCKI